MEASEILVNPGAGRPAAYSSTPMTNFAFDEVGNETCGHCGRKLSLHIWQALGYADLPWVERPTIDCATV